MKNKDFVVLKQNMNLKQGSCEGLVSSCKFFALTKRDPDSKVCKNEDFGLLLAEKFKI